MPLPSGPLSSKSLNRNNSDDCRRDLDAESQLKLLVEDEPLVGTKPETAMELNEISKLKNNNGFPKLIAIHLREDIMLKLNVMTPDRKWEDLVRSAAALQYGKHFK
jgi:hypothetical protein